MTRIQLPREVCGAIYRTCAPQGSGTHHAVPTENSVPINQHPCGTLIADLVDALSLLARTSESKGWQSLPRPDVECT